MVYRLRLQTAHGLHNVTIDPSLTLEEFLKIPEINISSPSAPAFKIKSGFPPTAIDLSDLSLLLQNSGVQNGDRLIIEKHSDVAADLKRPRSSSSSSQPPQNTQQKHQKNEPPYSQSNKSYNSWVLPNGTALVRRKVPADNSCFFRSVAQAYYRDPSCASLLRQSVVNYIESPENPYTEIDLGRSKEDYCDWILKETSWGGGIEAGILSIELGIRIITIGISTGAKIDVADQGLQNFMILLYDGSHYDLLVQTPSLDYSFEGDDVAIFKPFNLDIHDRDTFVKQEDVLENAVQFAKTLELPKPPIDPEDKDTEYRCSICQRTLKGLKGITEHAEAFGHVDFQDIKK